MRLPNSIRQIIQLGLVVVASFLAGIVLQKYVGIGNLLLPLRSVANPTAPAKNQESVTILEPAKIPELKEIAPYPDCLVYSKVALNKQGEEDSAYLVQWGIKKNVKQVSAMHHQGKVLDDLKLVSFSDRKHLQSSKSVFPDEFDFELPLLFDAAQVILAGPRRGNLSSEWNFGSAGNLRFGVFLARAQEIEFTCLGDSRVMAGIDPAILGLELGMKGSNIAIPSAGVDSIELMVRDYLPLATNNRLVVIGISDRIFMSNFSDVRAEDIKKSPGHSALLDRGSEFAAELDALVLLRATQRSTNFYVSPEGWVSMNFEETTEQRLSEFKVGAGKAKGTVNEAELDRFLKLTNGLTAQGTTVVLVSNPIHPISQTTLCVDDSGTSRSDSRKIKSRLEEAARQTERLHYIDFNQEGAHGIDESEFLDGDHLNFLGARTFSIDLAGRIRALLVETPGFDGS